MTDLEDGDTAPTFEQGEPGAYALYSNDNETHLQIFPTDEGNKKGNVDGQTSLAHVVSGSLAGAFSEKNTKTLIQAMYMIVFAMLGAGLRIALAQLFGDECRNPGTVGWLASGSPLCVTADGAAEDEGGIIFADLPANMIGSFIMGMMQPTAALDLPVSVNIAWTTTNSWFQGWDIIHLAIRTGFCGSLTTFSSWNSAMIVLVFGTGSNYSTQIMRALFGYIIGMETSLGSFVFGKRVAVWFCRLCNPDIAEETEAIIDKKEEGVYINPTLPDFERRFLPDLDMPTLTNSTEPERLELLEKWRISTERARRVGHEDLKLLCDIEDTTLTKRLQISNRVEAAANEKGWDVDSLMRWARGTAPPPEKPIPNDCFLFTKSFSISIVLVLYIALVAGLAFIQNETAYAVTYRTMVYALILAPPGALLRWQLSSLNGSLQGRWQWFPTGTLVANVFGAMVSITAISLEYISPAKGFWRIGTLRAVKTGFAGSLTTVSTFVAEVHGFSKNAHTQDRSYIYIFSTLIPSCLIGVIIYALICFGKGYH